MNFMWFWIWLCVALLAIGVLVWYFRPAITLGGEMIGPSIQERNARKVDS